MIYIRWPVKKKGRQVDKDYEYVPLKIKRNQKWLRKKPNHMISGNIVITTHMDPYMKYKENKND